MNIKQLKKAIADLPDHMDVAMQVTTDEFPLLFAVQAKVITAHFSENPGGKVLAKDKVFVLTDEFND